MKIVVPSFALWIFFGILVVIFILFSLIFEYHWNNYGIGKKRGRIVRLIYSVVSLVILALIALFIGLYNF